MGNQNTLGGAITTGIELVSTSSGGNTGLTCSGTKCVGDAATTFYNVASTDSGGSGSGALFTVVVTGTGRGFALSASSSTISTDSTVDTGGGDDGTWALIKGTGTTSGQADAVFTVVIASNVITSVTATTAGTNYITGETITLSIDNGVSTKGGVGTNTLADTSSTNLGTFSVVTGDLDSSTGKGTVTSIICTNGGSGYIPSTTGLTIDDGAISDASGGTDLAFVPTATSFYNVYENVEASAGGSGAGAKFRVVTAGTSTTGSTIKSVQVTSPGWNYANSEVLTF